MSSADLMDHLINKGLIHARKSRQPNQLTCPFIVAPNRIRNPADTIPGHCLDNGPMRPILF